jgi:uncharacterized protein
MRVGLGYRRKLHDELMALDARALDFVELAPENYAGIGGKWRRRLHQIESKWPIITHGLALSLGGEDPLDETLIAAVAELTHQVETPHHSDHLCFSAAGGSHLHELLPIPFTRANARRIAERIKSVQSELSMPLAIENVSAYARLPEDELDEPEFLSEVIERAGCKILLDVNNVFVNATNFKKDPHDLLARMPAEQALQIHVAGFWRESDELLIDTHGEPVADPVWPLLEAALARTGPVPVLLERDHNFPPIAELMAEIAVIRRIGERVFGASNRAEATHG